MPIIICPECGTSKSIPPSSCLKGQKYCSKECSVTHKAKPNVKCSECGTPVKRKPRELGKFVNFFCSDSCQSKFRLKEVGASADKITESRKRSQKKRLKKERGDICEVCNWSRGVCDVHHIVPVYKGGSELDSNLIILCPNCHRLAHLGQLVLDNRDL